MTPGHTAKVNFGALLVAGVVAGSVLLIVVGCDGNGKGELASSNRQAVTATVTCTATFLDAQDGKALGSRPITMKVSDILNDQFLEACLILAKNDPLPDTLSVRCNCDPE